VREREGKEEEGKGGRGRGGKEREGREGEGRDRGLKLLLNQGPSEPCYATGRSAGLITAPLTEISILKFSSGGSQHSAVSKRHY